MPETLTHVFTCPSTITMTFRLTQQEKLWKQLDLINTPPEVLKAIQLGIKGMEADDPVPPISQQSVSIAFNAQTELGWNPF